MREPLNAKQLPSLAEGGVGGGCFDPQERAKANGEEPPRSGGVPKAEEPPRSGGVPKAEEPPRSGGLPTPLIVLKFGSSVLRREQDVHGAVHEIYRWVRDGWRVVAVVSAFEGVTDRLLTRARGFGEPPNEAAAAILAATGEAESAAVLGLALDRAGVPARVLDAAATGVRTEGSPLESRPVGLDGSAIGRALTAVPVVVVPGFVGRDDEGRTTLLGRGGSDLTAVFLAHHLRAERCRLLKDVDGIYARDPALPGPKPTRYGALPWDEAGRVAGKLVQPRAIDFAATHGVEFEVSALHERCVTRIGRLATEEESGARHEPLRVVLLGCGTVGLGVYRSLAGVPELARVVKVVVRDRAKAERRGVDPRLLGTDVFEAVELDADVVVEAIGGLDPAIPALRRALELGRHVVTANKAAIAAAGTEFEKLATANGRSLAYSAAVGGATPVIENVARVARSEHVRRIEAVLNGTTNFVLERVAAGEPFDAAVAEAQVGGLAEPDPSRDLDGIDAADKAAILMRAAFGVEIDPADIPREPLNVHTLRDRNRTGPGPGYRLRQVARIENHAGGATAAVTLEWLPADHGLAQLRGEENGAVIESETGSRAFVRGKGAGRWPSAEAVMADLLDVVRRAQPSGAAAAAKGGPREVVVRGEAVLRAIGAADESSSPRARALA